MNPSIVLLLLLLVGRGLAAEVEVSWGVQIPMRDGVNLNATVFRPADQADGLPVIFTMTPYISDTYHDRARYFAGNGYVYALVDVRGRGNSDGQFTPFANDAEDGHDVVQWFSGQDYCDGQVAMWGGSYAGWNQWMTASRAPDNLATIVPAASPWLGVDFPMSGGVFFSYAMRWLTLTSGVTPNSRLFGDSDWWDSVYLKRYQEHLPFKQLDELAGNASTVFEEWLLHPSVDAYWQTFNPSDRQYASIDMPVLTITGHWDGDQAGAMEHYRRHMAHGSEAARTQHYLIIGPWDHADTRTPDGEVAGMEFDEASKLDLNALHKAWYDWALKGGEKPEFLQDRVAVYVTGQEQWRYAPALEAVSNASLALMLDSDGTSGDAFQSGQLTETPQLQAAFDSYRYDPLDLRPGEIEVLPGALPQMLNQSWAVSTFGNGVVYHSAPLEEPLEITGVPRLEVWLEIDQPDTDFSVNLYEITQDGQSIFLTSQLLRARYRQERSVPRPVPRDQPVFYQFDGFTFFSRELAKGSRLRLLINSPNSIHLQKNYNSGGDVSAETSEDAATVNVKVYHDELRPSRLVLPVFRPE